MEKAFAPTATLQPPHSEYRIAKGWGIFIYIFTPPLLCLFVFTAFMPFLRDGIDWILVLILTPLSLGMTALMSYGLLDTIKSKFIIQEEGVKKVGIFKNKELSLHEIKGFRTDQYYIHIVPQHEQLPKIKISTYYGNTRQLINWLDNNFPNLDLEDQLSEEQEILSKEEFGWNAEQRVHRLNSARSLAKALNYSGTAVGLWLFFYPHPYKLATGIALVFPLLVILGLNMYRGLIRIDEKKNSAYPSLFTALLMPSMGLLLRGLLEFDVLDYQNLWVPIAILTVVLTGTLIMRTREFKSKKAADFFSVAAIGMFMAAFSYGACIHINCMYDPSVPELFQAEILSKHISSGKHTSYKLELTAWGPRQEIEEVSVPAYLYEQMEVGETVNIYLKAGVLEVPWFVVTEP